MRKLAKLAAMAVAAVMSVSVAFAGYVDGTKDEAASVDKNGMFSYDLRAAGATTADQLNGKTVEITFTTDCKDFNGGVMINGKTCGWDQDDANRSYFAKENGDYKDGCWEPVADGNTYKLSFKLKDNQFGADDFADGGYAQICVQQWAGSSDLTMTSIKVEGLSKAEPEKPADKPDTDPNNQTGDATSVIALGAVALLALAGVAYTKKNA